MFAFQALSVSLLGLFLPASRLVEPPQLALEQFAPPIRRPIQEAYDALRSRPEDAQSNGQLGMLLYAYQQNQSASVCFERAHALDPQEFRWTYYLATLQAALGSFTRATSLFREALQQRPDYLPAQLKLAETFLASGNLDESMHLYESLLRGHQELALAHYGLGRVLLVRKDFAGAIGPLRRACELFPNFGASHYALAMAYRGLYDGTNAQEHLSLHQKDKLGRPSLDDPLLEAIEKLRVGAHDYLKQGVTLEAAGQLEQAAAAHEQALQIDPKLEQAYINLISLYGRLRQPEKAESQYKFLLSINPNLAEAHYNFGVLLTNQGRLDDALDAFRRALEINPFYAEAHNNYAFLLLNEGRLEEAAQHFRTALENKTNYRLAHFHLGRILLHQNKIDEAIDHFQQALGNEEDDNTPGYLYALGAAYSRAGNRQNALQYIRQARLSASARGQKELLESIERDLRILEQAESRK